MLHAIILEESTDYGNLDYGGVWKKLIREMFEEFILFFAPELYHEIDFSKSPDFLQQELFHEIISSKNNFRMANQIVKAPLINGKEKWIHIHIEVKEKADNEFRKRMFHYFYRIYDLYDQEIYAIALLTNSKRHFKQDYFDYHYYGTSLIYKYNVFHFKDQNIEKLKVSSNPFAVAVLASIYSNQSNGDTLNKFTFKRKLMIHVLNRFSLEKEKARQYIQALFYFIDYLLQTPETLQQKLRKEITMYMKEAKEVNQKNPKFTPIWDGVMEDLEKIWSEKALLKGLEEGKKRGMLEGILEGRLEGRLEGKKEATIQFAKKLLLENFTTEKVIELTDLTFEEVQKIKENI